MDFMVGKSALPGQPVSSSLARTKTTNMPMENI